MSDEIRLALLAVLVPSLIMYGLCSFFDKFIALKSLPDRRAVWTVGLSYFVVSVILSLYAFELLPKNADISKIALGVVIPILGPLPAALILFRTHRKNYRARWVEDESELRDGVKLSNDDWRIGLGFLIAAAAIIVIRKLPLFL